MPRKLVITITKEAVIKCSAITFHGLAFAALAILKLKIPKSKNPQITLIITAVESSKIKTGTTNVKAKINLAKNVEIVDCQTSFAVWTFSDSSEI